MGYPGFRSVVAASLIVPLFACERAPLEIDCPDVGLGGLVISEVRGDQEGDQDSQGQWIEVYNASGVTIDLVGLRIVLKTLDGSSIEEFTVRRSVPVTAGGYATLGSFNDDQLPSHINYGYADELDRNMNTTGAIELVACGDEIDQVVYQALPELGTLALDGALSPDAAANDDQANFCVDSAGAGEGTPQKENPPCT